MLRREYEFATHWRLLQRWAWHGNDWTDGRKNWKIASACGRCAGSGDGIQVDIASKGELKTYEYHR